MHNKNSLDTLAAALAHAIKIEPPKEAAPANPDLVRYIDETFGEAGASVIT